MDKDKAKKSAAAFAASLILPGSRIGLGTGSTAEYFIEELSKKVHSGLKISAVSTSSKSEALAKKGKIPLLDVNGITSLDVVVDGADEIDAKKQMIKGGGGALLREKIVAAMAREMIVIVDASKCVKSLGKFPLPVEILSFGFTATLQHLREAGFHPKLRENFITDNGHLIADLHFNANIHHPDKLNQQLHLIPGVVETGLFLKLAGRVIVGYGDGKVEVR